MTNPDIAKIDRWMHRNTRGLELAKWRFYLEDGSAGTVVNELQYYQNTGGGFTHTLEADCWNPVSTPLQMFYAIHILHELDYKDKTHPVIREIMRYLESGKDMENGSWISTSSSNNEYPRTPWWAKTERKTFDIYMSNADICWFVLDFAQKNSSLYTKAESMIQRMLDLFLSQKEAEPHSLRSMIFLLRELQRTEGFYRPQIDAAAAHGIQLMWGLIEEDPSHQNVYYITPSFSIHDCPHPSYPGYGTLLKLEVQGIVEIRDAEG